MGPPTQRAGFDSGCEHAHPARTTASEATACARVVGWIGLAEKLVEASGDRALAVLGMGVGSHRRDRNPVPACGFKRTDLAHHRVAVLGGHGNVGQHEVGGEFRQRSDGGSRRQCGAYRSAIRPQHLEHHLARFAIVIDDQDAYAIEPRRASGRARRATAVACRHGWLTARQLDHEPCAGVMSIALGAHPAAVELYQVTNDRQAQPKP